MKEPTRYSPFLNQHGGRYIPSMDCPDMKEDNEGDWVSLSDYKQLQAEVERLNELANDPYRLSKGWRPIETAPMDGTDILCWCVEPEFEGEENPHTEQRVCFFGQMQEDYSCWMSHYGYEQRPTHWMPLPKPPAL